MYKLEIKLDPLLEEFFDKVGINLKKLNVFFESLIIDWFGILNHQFFF